MGRNYKSKKKNSSNIGIVIIAVIAVIFWNSDDDNKKQSSTNSVTQKTEKTSNKKVNFSGYANKSTENTWPETNGEAIDIAEKLTTTNYYLVLDGSGSMGDSQCSGNLSKMAVAKDAVTSFIKQIPQDANLGLFVFDSKGATERVKLGPNNRSLMEAEIRSAYANGGTPLKAAISKGFLSLEEQAKKQLGYGEYHLVVITDGEASKNQHPDKVVDYILQTSPVLIHTIGFCIDGRHSLNQAGRINYKQANDPKSLSQGLQEVLAESPSFQQDAFEG